MQVEKEIYFQYLELFHEDQDSSILSKGLRFAHSMHSMSSNGNHMTGISSIGSGNNDFPTGWIGGFSPTQYGSTVSPLYHNHIPTGTIAGFNGVNIGFGGNDDIPTGWAFNN